MKTTGHGDVMKLVNQAFSLVRKEAQEDRACAKKLQKKKHARAMEAKLEAADFTEAKGRNEYEAANIKGRCRFVPLVGDGLGLWRSDGHREARFQNEKKATTTGVKAERLSKEADDAKEEAQDAKEVARDTVADLRSMQSEMRNSMRVISES